MSDKVAELVQEQASLETRRQVALTILADRFDMAAASSLQAVDARLQAMPTAIERARAEQAAEQARQQLEAQAQRQRDIEALRREVDALKQQEAAAREAYLALARRRITGERQLNLSDEDRLFVEAESALIDVLPLISEVRQPIPPVDFELPASTSGLLSKMVERLREVNLTLGDAVLPLLDKRQREIQAAARLYGAAMVRDRRTRDIATRVNEGVSRAVPALKALVLPSIGTAPSHLHALIQLEAPSDLLNAVVRQADGYPGDHS